MSETLDELLASWAKRYELSEAQRTAIRANVLAAHDLNSSEPDVEWLWDLLRPVTALLDGPQRLHDTLSRPFARLAQ